MKLFDWDDFDKIFDREHEFTKKYLCKKLEDDSFHSKEIFKYKDSYKDVFKTYKSINSINNYISKIQYSFSPNKIVKKPMFSPQTQEQLAALLNMDTDQIRAVATDIISKGFQADVIWCGFDFETMAVVAIKFLKHFDPVNNRFPIVAIKINNSDLSRVNYTKAFFFDSRHANTDGFSWIFLLSDEIANMCKLASNPKMNLLIEINILLALRKKYHDMFPLKKLFHYTDKTIKSLDVCIKLLEAYGPANIVETVSI